MLEKLVGVYTKSQQTMAEEAKNPPSRIAILAHTMANGILLNCWMGLLFYQLGIATVMDVLLLGGYFLVIAGFTALAIIGIEWVTHKAAASKGGKATYWQQLAITNLYLTPLFFIFAGIVIIIVIIAPTTKTHLPADVVVAIVASRMNTKKINAIHNIKDSLPDIAYGIGMIVAYVIWALLIVSPVILLGLLGIY